MIEKLSRYCSPKRKKSILLREVTINCSYFATVFHLPNRLRKKNALKKKWRDWWNSTYSLVKLLLKFDELKWTLQNLSTRLLWLTAGITNDSKFFKWNLTSSIDVSKSNFKYKWGDEIIQWIWQKISNKFCFRFLLRILKKSKNSS